MGLGRATRGVLPAWVSAVGLAAWACTGACTGACAAAPDAPAAPAAPAAVSEGDAYEIGVEAYTYLYPLVLMDVTRRQATNVEPGKMLGRGPMNTFVHAREYPPADYRDVVRPNFDTLYSSAWLDLTGGPVVVSAPGMGERYYLLPMLDMWTDCFASPGTRTTGNGAQRLAVVPPGWRGELPAGVQRIDAPTPYVWVIGRTKTDGPADYAAVHALQDAMSIEPLSGKPAGAARIDPSVDMKTPPVFQVERMTPERFFTSAAELLAVNPPHATDQPVLARMARIGLVAGRPLDWAKADPVVVRALERAAPDALRRITTSYGRTAAKLNGWSARLEGNGVYGSSYLLRAGVAKFGLGTNVPEDAIYPNRSVDDEGKPLVGTSRYTMRFEKGQLPPVGAFWSLTLYDKDGFAVENPLRRYAIGDRDAIGAAPDGSVTLYVQHASPGKDKEANWLPAPEGEFVLQLRLYWPKAEALDGRWSPPKLLRAE